MKNTRKNKTPSLPEVGPVEGQKPDRSFFIVVSIFLAVCVLIKLPILQFEHNEPDEQVYWQLTEHWVHTGHYNIKGTAILPWLSPYVYDRGLFHR